METIYSLENHLKAWGEIESKYKRLDEIYAFNKIIIKDALDESDRYFSFYSRHDSSHSETIISSIESLLGESRIKQLGPTDTLLILLAAYLHDCGMCLQYREIKEMLSSGDFNKFVEELSNNKYYEPYTNWFKNNDFSVQYFDEKFWPLDSITCVSILISEFYRTKHGDNSEKAIKNNFSGHEININPCKHLPERLESVLGKICSLHTKSFTDVMLLDQEANGAYNDKIHPRFLAVLIRIADLLDLDNNRFSQAKLATLCDEIPAISRIHYNKHKSIKSFLVTPQKINITAESNDDEALREMRNWIKYLDKELKELSEHWNDIIPNGFDGGVPKLNTRVVKSNAEISFSETNLKLNLPENKAFQIIQGANIYSHNLIFIRECIQNALDALKIQFWHDLVDSYENFNVEDEINNIEDINKLITERYFLGQLDNIIDQYGIKIRIFDCRKSEELDAFKVFFNSTNYKGEDYTNRIVVVIEDNGTGISLENFINRILNVGKKSKCDDDSYEKTKNMMPAFLKPTGEFGIGLHSCFLITDHVIIHTRTIYDQCQGIEIIIESGEKNGYVQCNKWEVMPDKRGIRRGTQTIVSIDPRDIIIDEQYTQDATHCNFPFASKKYDYLIDYIVQVSSNVIVSPTFGVKFYNHHNIIINKMPEMNDLYKDKRKMINDIRVTKEEKEYYVRLSRGQDSNQNLYLKVYELTEGHSLELEIKNKWDQGTNLITLFKGVLLNTDILETNLKRYLIRGTVAIINYNLKETAKYITLDREKVTNLGRDTFEEIFSRLIKIGMEQIPRLLTEYYQDNKKMQIYYDSRRKLEVLALTHISEFNCFLANYKSNNIEIFDFSVNEKETEIFKRLIEEYGSIPIQVYISLLASKIWDNVELYLSYELQNTKNKMQDIFINAINTFFEVIGITNVDNIGINQEYIKYILFKQTNKIGGYALDFLSTYNGLLDRNYIDKNGKNIEVKFYFNNTFPALNIFLYHLKFGQGHVLANQKYMQIIEVLSDHYIHDSDYGNSSMEETNTFNDTFLYCKDDKLKMKEVIFGSDAIQHYDRLFIIPEKIFENERDYLVATYPIQIIEMYPVNEGKREYYMKVLFKHPDNKEKVAFKNIGEYAKDYWFIDMIKQGYLDVEEYGSIYFNECNMYCIPALEDYKYIAINKLPYEFEKVYKNSRFKYINQESYIMFPIEKKQIEEWGGLFEHSSNSEFEKLVLNCRNKIINNDFTSDIDSHINDNNIYKWDYLETYYLENHIDLYKLFLNSCKIIVHSKTFEEIINYTYENRSFSSDDETVDDAKKRIAKDYLHLLRDVFLYVIKYYYPGL